MTDRDAQRLAKIDEKMEQMKAQRQDIFARDKKRQRKERTRRLIQIGAMTEKYFNVKDIQPKDFEIILQQLFAHPNAKEYLARVNSWLDRGVNDEQRVDTESATSGL